MKRNEEERRKNRNIYNGVIHQRKKNELMSILIDDCIYFNDENHLLFSLKSHYAVVLLISTVMFDL